MNKYLNDPSLTFEARQELQALMEKACPFYVRKIGRWGSVFNHREGIVEARTIYGSEFVANNC